MEWYENDEDQPICDRCEIVMDFEDEDDRFCADCFQDQFGDEEE
jgi:hypothetical protein